MVRATGPTDVGSEDELRDAERRRQAAVVDRLLDEWRADPVHPLGLPYLPVRRHALIAGATAAFLLEAPALLLGPRGIALALAVVGASVAGVVFIAFLDKTWGLPKRDLSLTAEGVVLPIPMVYAKGNRPRWKGGVRWAPIEKGCVREVVVFEETTRTIADVGHHLLESSGDPAFAVRIDYATEALVESVYVLCHLAGADVIGRFVAACRAAGIQVSFDLERNLPRPLRRPRWRPVDQV